MLYHRFTVKISDFFPMLPDVYVYLFFSLSFITCFTSYSFCKTSLSLIFLFIYFFSQGIYSLLFFLWPYAFSFSLVLYKYLWHTSKKVRKQVSNWAHKSTLYFLSFSIKNMSGAPRSSCLSAYLKYLTIYPTFPSLLFPPLLFPSFPFPSLPFPHLPFPCILQNQINKNR